MAVTDTNIYDWINAYASGDAGPPATNSPIGTDVIGTDLDDQFRNLKSVVRQESINKAWERYRGLYGTLAYVSGTQFTVTKTGVDQTDIFAVGRRVRATIVGSVLTGTITVSTYLADVTTVTVAWDTGTIDATLSEVELGLFLPTQPFASEINLGTTKKQDKILLYKSGNTKYGMGVDGNDDLIIFTPIGEKIVLGEMSTADGTSLAAALTIEADQKVTLAAQATGTGHAVRADRAVNITGGSGGGNLTADRTLVVTKQTHHVPHTFTYAGEVKVASGDTDFINPFWVPVLAGTTVTLKRVRYKINSGTSATVKLTKNGGDLAGYTGISVTTTAAETAADAAMADNDLIALVVTGVAGTPVNLSFTLVFAVAATY